MREALAAERVFARVQTINIALLFLQAACALGRNQSRDGVFVVVFCFFGLFGLALRFVVHHIPRPSRAPFACVDFLSGTSGPISRFSLLSFRERKCQLFVSTEGLLKTKRQSTVA